MKLSILSAFAILVLLTTPNLVQADVRVSESTIALPTWSEGPADTNPLFDLFRSAGSYNGVYASYPYTYRTNFLQDHPSQSWRILNLENEYLFCRVFPDLGGHLYSCLDKTSGREMFYANPVIRKAYVGLRGAWVAMGIELNFPVGHSLTSVSPVSYGIRQNADGSASAWVADIDRQTGLEWRVEYLLQSGSAILQENVNLYNRGDARQPYYFWSNAGVKIEDQNSRFAYPTNLTATHAFTFLDTWPVNLAGVDVSVVRNIVDQQGLFAHGTNEPFEAIYHPSTRAGTVHYASTADVPGKKLWSWGSGQYGDSWVQANLTDNFPSYLETQGGITVNQETHLFLDPQQARHFTEYWMPARELDGVSRANLNGVLFFGRRNTANGSQLVAELNPNRAIPNAGVRILNGSTAIFSETVNLTPAATYTRAIDSPSGSVKYTFQLVDNSSGAILLTHTEGQYDALTPAAVMLGPQPAVDLSKSDTDQQVLARADYNERLQLFAFAEADYALGLQKFPQSIPLLKASGRLAATAGRYDDAVTQLQQVVASVPSDTEAHFYLGLAYLGQGQDTSAANEWTGIQSSPDFGRAANFELACLRALTGDLASAVNLFEAVNSGSQDDVRAGAMEVAVLRHQGQTAAASAKLAAWRNISPTDLFLRFEQALQGTQDDALWMALGAEPERVLNLADDYFRLGFFDDALALLSRTYPDAPALQREPGAVNPQNNALVAYYRGYSRKRLGGSGTADFNAASNLPLPYIFPNRSSSINVLREAIHDNLSDATAHYLLGLVFMSRRMSDDAIAEWQIAGTLRTDLPGLYRNLGRALLDVRKEAQAALPVLKQGTLVDSGNPDVIDAYNRALASVSTPSNCTFALSGVKSFGPGALTGSIAVTPSTSSCTWSAVSYPSWIRISSVSNGTVSFTLASNPNVASRSGALSIGGQLFVVTQAGANCSYSLTSPSGTTTSSGGPVSIGVVTSPGCVWTATSNQPWISLASTSWSGSGSLTANVGANQASSRTGGITIAGQPFAVSQVSNRLADTNFFVNQLYLDLLDRSPDLTGFAFWIGQLNSGALNRAQVAGQFATSPEFQGNGLYVIKLYESILHRDPDFTGWLFYFNSLIAGGSQAAALNSFLSSPEFQATYGNPTAAEFVNLVYRNVLGRDPDPTGFNFWVTGLNTGAVSRAGLVDQFIRSPEYDRIIRARAQANLLYMGFLRRSADPTGLTYWTGVLANPSALPGAISGFITSAEYQARF